jgi:heptosyltransferase-2
MNYHVFNFGGMNERINIEHQNYTDFAGYQELQDSINLMSRCNYFIANDSGLMHVADAMNIPLIALFGSTLVTKNRPVNKDSHVLVGNLPCQPCQYHQRFNECTDYQCMKKVSIENILDLMKELRWN